MILNLRSTSIADTLTIIPTYQCTSACKDCCFGSNPQIRGRLSQENVLKAISEAAKSGIRLLVFSGGECFLLGKDLDAAIAYATQLGMVSRCVTNGYWATHEEVARRRLEELQNAGLTEINFSTGDMHQQFVPVERVINGCMSALALKMRCAVMVEIRKDRKFTQTNLLSDARLNRILKGSVESSLFSVVESPWMPSEPGSVVDQDANLLVNATNVIARDRCTSVVSTFVLDPYGQVGACCGLTRHRIPEMMLGSIEEHSLSSLIDSAINDFLKIWIYVEGPEKIIAWAAGKDPSIEWKDRYAHVCHACLALYQDQKVKQVIRDFHEEKIADVYFRYFLLTQYEAASIDSNSAPHREKSQLIEMH